MTRSPLSSRPQSLLKNKPNMYVKEGGLIFAYLNQKGGKNKGVSMRFLEVLHPKKGKVNRSPPGLHPPEFKQYLKLKSCPS